MRLAVLFLLAACNQATVKIGDISGGSDLDGETGIDDTGGGDTGETGDTGDTTDTSDTADTGEDYSEYDDARLVILSPASGAFLPYGQTAAFSAEVIGADGNVMDFDDIEWASDIDTAWSLAGAAVEDSTLGVGTHAITATARLPNGDRLAYTVGGVLVQSEYTGVYTGTLSIDMTVSGYTAGCAGGATLIVDAYGELITGDATCLISLGKYSLDTSWVFDLTNTAGVLTGATGADLVWFTYDFDSTGTLTTDGVLDAAFASDVYGVATVSGSVSATRISRDVSAYE